MRSKMLWFTLLAMSATAMAQEQVNSAQYHAIHNPNSPYYEGPGQQPSMPPVQWANRWGAIASDGNGTYGIVSDITSKRKAQKAAIQECKNRGGGACNVDLAYQNQCAAIGAGDANSFSSSAPTLKEATDRALQRCELQGGGNCRVYYSGCSTAVRVQ